MSKNFFQKATKGARAEVIKKKTTEIKKTSAVKKASNCCIDEAQLSDMIKERAYYIWEEKGKPAGLDNEIWIQAQQEICARFKK